MILQNVLQSQLPPAFLATLPKRQEVAYAIIPQIPSLPEPLRSEVHAAFADGTRLVWKVMIALSAAGLLTCLLMREEPMNQEGAGEGEVKGGHDDVEENEKKSRPSLPETV